MGAQSAHNGEEQPIRAEHHPIDGNEGAGGGGEADALGDQKEHEDGSVVGIDLVKSEQDDDVTAGEEGGDEEGDKVRREDPLIGVEDEGGEAGVLPPEVQK